MKVKTVSKLKKELDSIFSKSIRLRDKNVCYTCGKVMEGNMSQCGHFVPRQYLKTRYSQINCHCQCYACNCLYNGQPSRYAQRLRSDYGDAIIDELEHDRLIPVKLDVIWYSNKILEYQEKYATLQSQSLNC